MSQEKPTEALVFADADTILNEFLSLFEHEFSQIEKITGMESINGRFEEMSEALCNRLNQSSLIFLLKNNMYADVALREKLKTLKHIPFSDNSGRFNSIEELETGVTVAFHIFLEKAIGERLEEVIAQDKTPKEVPTENTRNAMDVIDES